MRQHLLQISDLSADMIHRFMMRATEFIEQGAHLAVKNTLLSDKTVVNLFFEACTRTRVSFELAAKRLSATVVNIAPQRSSLQKNESLLDTLQTLHAMACDYFIVRHCEEGMVQYLADHMHNKQMALINAGDGIHAHPSQALLDMLTIAQHKNDFSRLSVAIVGDISHSRVANSNRVALRTLGVPDIRLVAPEYFMTPQSQQTGTVVEPNINQGLAGVDVVIVLRIQKERLEDDALPDLEAYRQAYGLTEARLALAKPDAIVLHPGPMNRGIEIDSVVADGVQSCISKQIINGVAMRMAILAECAHR